MFDPSSGGGGTEQVWGLNRTSSGKAGVYNARLFDIPGSSVLGSAWFL